MSKNVRTVGWRTRTENASTRLVLTYLAAHAGKDLLAWPNQKTLARLCGVTDRTVRTALRELEALGEISIVEHGQGRGSTVYRLDILARDFEVIEADENRKTTSGLEMQETGRRVPVSDTDKPEIDDPETGTPLPIEETNEEPAPGLPASVSDGEDWILAENEEDLF